jgi:hypothetical protein
LTAIDLYRKVFAATTEKIIELALETGELDHE